MRVGDLARETGVSKRLLRRNEGQGLFRPARSDTATATTLIETPSR
ncbi:MerR family transcriptional regulator [Streptomyces sp. SID9727]|nr:MerR family transcriptional regulator [Streptomyces sp. SID9727]NEC65977.1 MerR family transcriptional regulator [Streptomyces sp. SID9727]